ncbi:hypothetical protein BD626DRAFT_638181, partial [Schizophyllum amplum]
DPPPDSQLLLHPHLPRLPCRHLPLHPHLPNPFAVTCPAALALVLFTSPDPFAVTSPSPSPQSSSLPPQLRQQLPSAQSSSPPLHHQLPHSPSRQPPPRDVLITSPGDVLEGFPASGVRLPSRILESFPRPSSKASPPSGVRLPRLLAQGVIAPPPRRRRLISLCPSSQRPSSQRPFTLTSSSSPSPPPLHPRRLSLPLSHSPSLLAQSLGLPVCTVPLLITTHLIPAPLAATPLVAYSSPLTLSRALPPLHPHRHLSPPCTVPPRLRTLP